MDNLTLVETEYNNVLASIDIISEKEKYINKQLNNDEKELSKKVRSTTNDRIFALKTEILNLEGAVKFNHIIEEYQFLI